MKNLIFLVAFLAIFSGCTARQMLNYEPSENFKDENLSFQIDSNWYKLYNQNYLNELISLVLKQNIDLKISAINLAKAYENAGLITADFFPTISANSGFSANRDILVNDNFSKSYSNRIGASFELDLFGKILASKNSAEWFAKASEFDLQAAKLSLINSITNSYFKGLYLNEALNFTEQNLQSYEKLGEIVQVKFEYGKSEMIELKQIQSSILSLKNRRLSLISQIQNNELFMRNLLNADQNFTLPNIQIESVKFLGVDLNVPYTALSNRPDLRSAISAINSSFYDYRVSLLSFYPSISLGANLSSSNENFDDSFKLNFFGGNVSVALPFLDFYRLEKRLKISKLDFEKAVLNYEKSLSLAVNEVRNLYEIYEISLQNLRNLEKSYVNSEKIAEIYKAKYDEGRAELKDYLQAKTSAIEAKISLISQYYAVLETENSIYNAMAGKFSIK